VNDTGKSIPLVDLAPQHAEIADEALSAIFAVVQTGRFILGEPVERFERTIARVCGAGYAVGVASGTDALVLALRAVGVREGDRVVTTPLTFAATAEAIVRAGGWPLFCDIDSETLNLSPEAVRATLASLDREVRAKVRAIVPVHLFGRACDMQALGAVAEEHGLSIVEDAAQAVGAKTMGRPVGGIGAAGCLSFFPSKNLGAWGDAGAVATNDPRIAAHVRRLRGHGLEDGRVVELGMNSRLDAIQAAVLEVKAARIEAWTKARQLAAERYRRLLAPLAECVVVPPSGAPGSHVFHQYVIRVRDRDALAARLAREGIASRAYCATPLHLEPCFAHEREKAALAHAERASKEMLAIPMFYGITEAQQERVAHAIAGGT
jgi:dTDP-4-amino-4,6-dideoxygalactose transaminase